MAITLFVAAVPVFLIATNVRWVINASLLYSYGFAKHDSTARTGIERSELMSASRQIRDYFNNDEEYLAVGVVVQGVRVQNLYNEREIVHMKDVKGLVRGVYRIQWVSGAYLAAFVAMGLILLRRGFLSPLARYLSLGGILTGSLVVLVGLAALVGFDQLFHAFHLVSFSNDFWQLDPRTDYLIAMFPEGFFLDGTIWIAGSTVVEAVILVFLWWRPRRVRQAARRLVAGVQGSGG